MFEPMNVRKNLRRERLEELAEDDLIPRNPGVVLGIRHRLLGVFFCRLNDQGFRWSGIATGQETEEASPSYRGQDLGAPPRIFLAREFI
jgi:hypothetical protein